MVDLTELKQRILATLEEAGADDANPILNTVIQPSGDPEEVVAYERALTDLLSNELIEVCLRSFAQGSELLSKEAGQKEIAKLTTFYVFDKEQEIWLDSRFESSPQAPEPEIVLTSAGLTAGESLLEERGFEWWRGGMAE